MSTSTTDQQLGAAPQITIPDGSFGPVTQTDIVRFAGAGGDFNPLHHDAAFAQQAGFEAPIAMGQFTAALLSTWLTDWCGVENLRAFSVQFKSPVNIGDTLTFSASVQDQTPEADRPGWWRISLDLKATVGDTPAVLGSAEVSIFDEVSEDERQPLWVPSTQRVEGSQMRAFQRWLEEHLEVSTSDYSSLHEWSVTETGEFWGAIWEYFGVVASE